MKNNIEKEKIFIFDFDHTIFDAQKFRQDIGKLLVNDPEMISEDIWNFFDTKDKRLFDFIKKSTDKYIFPNVIESIKKIKSEKILLTFGNKDFQELKIKSSFFDIIFDRVFLTDENKINFLESFVAENPGREIIFINDSYNKRFSENIEIAEKIPQIKIYEVENYNKDSKNTIQNILKGILSEQQ